MIRKHLVIGLLATTAAFAAQAQVTISEPWVRGTVPSQKATGAFMKIEAAQDVRLISATSPVAGVVEIHEMTMDGNVMKMRQLKDGLPIAKGQTAELKPGGHHVMLMDLKQQVKDGDQVPVTLTFENVADKKPFTQQITAPAKALGNTAAPAHGMKH
ncbi:copper chaperone PCu(A)C [Ottowia sp.]|uniref:copper chaperone PCu(A)C n=1 Tax=Ottowia sp. TaxID=1898956 RepID=UPI003A889E9D